MLAHMNFSCISTYFCLLFFNHSATGVQTGLGLYDVATHSAVCRKIQVIFQWKREKKLLADICFLLLTLYNMYFTMLLDMLLKLLPCKYFYCSLKYVHRRACGFQNLVGTLVHGGHNLPHPVGIGLRWLPKLGGDQSSRPYAHRHACLVCSTISFVIILDQNC